MSCSRAHVRTLGGRIGMAVLEPGSLVMERKMLRTIKQYAEALSRERDVGGALSS